VKVRGRHVTGVLLSLVEVEQVDEVPEPVLFRRRGGPASGLDGVRADERQVLELHLQLALAHVVRNQGWQRVNRILIAIRTLEVRELDQADRRIGAAEHLPTLRNSGKQAAGEHYSGHFPAR
jgi:hypothetical protein